MSSIVLQKVAQSLAGKVVVLIGGHRCPAAHAALEIAFRVRITWLIAKQHQAVRKLASAIRHPSVVLVILATRCISHLQGDLKQLCDRHGKALVRLPGGLNPNQVAFQILSQCSDRLQRTAS